MKLFKCREPLPYRPYLLCIERADKEKSKYEFDPIARLDKPKDKSWFRKFCERFFSRQKHKLEQ